MMGRVGAYLHSTTYRTGCVTSTAPSILSATPWPTNSSRRPSHVFSDSTGIARSFFLPRLNSQTDARGLSVGLFCSALGVMSTLDQSYRRTQAHAQQIIISI